MTKKYVAVTGANGRIGQILCNGLPEEQYSIYKIDIEPTPDDRLSLRTDLACSSSRRLVNAIIGSDAIVHLAWDSRENWRSGISVPENRLIAENICNAAVEAGVPRIIMASSIHADNFKAWQGPLLMKTEYQAFPQTPYGFTKVWLETRGRHFAQYHKLEVICIRFGGVTPDNTLRPEPLAEKIWLHTEDCVSLVKACIDVPKMPARFCIIYGVSNNTGRLHDISNPFGWIPKHDFASQNT